MRDRSRAAHRARDQLSAEPRTFRAHDAHDRVHAARSSTRTLGARPSSVCCERENRALDFPSRENWELWSRTPQASHARCSATCETSFCVVDHIREKFCGGAFTPSLTS